VSLPEFAPDAATLTIGSDRYPLTIVDRSISGHCLSFRHDEFNRVDNHGQSEIQTYEYASCPGGAVLKAYRTKDGRYRHKGSLVTVGRRTCYQDPAF
jgi:hypothetical protein